MDDILPIPVRKAEAEKRLLKLSTDNYRSYRYLYDLFYKLVEVPEAKDPEIREFEQGLSYLEKSLGPSNELVRDVATKFYQLKIPQYNTMITYFRNSRANEKEKPIWLQDKDFIERCQESALSVEAEKTQYKAEMLEKYGI